MRAVFLLLLLANVAVLGWSYFGAFGASDADLERQQLRPEAIRLLTVEQVARLPVKAADAKSALCIELGEFGVAEAENVNQMLEQLGLAGRAVQRRLEEVSGYWVYMPPQPNRAAATQKTAELKRLGIGDFYIVDDERWRHVISLGVFKTEDAAAARLEQLRARGVRTARIGPRDGPTQRIAFALREVPEAEARIAQLRQSFPGAELRDCARIAAR